jgi:U3 small nucleolar RNA-associated protein 7
MEALFAKAGPLPSKSKSSKWKGKGRSQGGTSGPKSRADDATLHSLVGSSSLPRSLQTPHAEHKLKGSLRKQTKDVKLNAHLTSIASHTELTKTLNSSLTAFIDDENKETGSIQLEPDSLRKTYQITQSEISDSLSSLSTALPSSLDIDLPNCAGGTYSAAVTREGRYIALLSTTGNLLAYDAHTAGGLHATSLKETCRSATFLHSAQFLAVAQAKKTYVYNLPSIHTPPPPPHPSSLTPVSPEISTPIELHELPTPPSPTSLAFLPYHHILVIPSLSPLLAYLDTTTGTLVRTHNTHLSSSVLAATDPGNSITYLTHSSSPGLVTLWSPNQPTPLVKFHAHNGPISSLSLYSTDQGFLDASPSQYLVTASSSAAGGPTIKLWDNRSLRAPLGGFNTLSAPPPGGPKVAVSQRGYLAVTTRSGVNVYEPTWFSGSTPSEPSVPSKFIPNPKLYLTHHLPSSQPPSIPLFKPYSDVLLMPTPAHLHPLIVPGSGSPNYSSLDVDPFESHTKRRKGEREIRGLVEKLDWRGIGMWGVEGKIASKDAAEAKREARAPMKEWRKMTREERLKAQGVLAKDDLEVEAADADMEEDEDANDNGSSQKNEPGKKVKEKRKQRGRDKALKRYLRKKKGITDESSVSISQFNRLHDSETRRRSQSERRSIQCGRNVRNGSSIVCEQRVRQMAGWAMQLIQLPNARVRWIGSVSDGKACHACSGVNWQFFAH